MCCIYFIVGGLKLLDFILGRSSCRPCSSLVPFVYLFPFKRGSALSLLQGKWACSGLIKNLACFLNHCLCHGRHISSAPSGTDGILPGAFPLFWEVPPGVWKSLRARVWLLPPCGPGGCRKISWLWQSEERVCQDQVSGFLIMQFSTIKEKNLNASMSITLNVSA